nr:LysM domain-containing protein [Peribacillus butanolivorans]
MVKPLQLGSTAKNSSSSDTYTVKSGDTLDKIAKAHKTTVQN